MRPPPLPQLGSVVKARFIDSKGSTKDRPGVVITHTADITPDGSVRVIGITSHLPEPPPKHVKLPFDPQGNNPSGLKRDCAAVVSWQADILVSDVKEVIGVLPPEDIKTLLETLKDSPALWPPAYDPKEQQQKEFQARMSALEKDQNFFFWVIVIALAAGILLCLISLGWVVVNWLNEHKFDTPNNWPAVWFFVLGILSLSFIPLLGSRQTSVKEQMQSVEFEDDLFRFAPPARENRAEKLLRIQEFQVRRYYDLNLSQNTWAFGFGVLCILIGAGIVIFTLYILRVATEQSLIVGVIGAIGAILSNFIAVIFLRMYSAVNDNLKSFHTQLAATYELFISYLLLSRIEKDPKREDALATLALAIRGTKEAAKNLVEEGEVEVPLVGATKKGEVEVYYRTSFAAQPQLTFPVGLRHGCFVAEQKPGSFKLKREETVENPSPSVSIRWRAEGVPGK